MDFTVSDSDERFRAELRAFLEERHPGRRPRDPDERLRWQRSWAATLYDAGWAAPSWPRRWGGMELPFTRQVVYHQEMARARVPGYPGTGVNIAGPTIVEYGTDEQRRRFLRPLLRADQVWAQGFSEPDAGSDLPSLRTRAERRGDRYVVTGQKVWSSAADVADVLYALVRTGPPDSRQDGISYLVIDLAGPGVTVRPLRDLTGGAGFSEILLEGVEVPVENRIGEENGGWPIARTSLGHERAAAGLAQASAYRRVVDELHALAAEQGVAGDARVRQQLADAEIRVRLLWLNAMRTISLIAREGEPGPGSSASRLFFSLFEQRLHELGLSLLGVRGLLGRSDPHAVQRGRWLWGMLRSRASTIGTGTAEIQRNTIGERVLGLPHEPAAGDGAPAREREVT